MRPVVFLICFIFCVGCVTSPPPLQERGDVGPPVLLKISQSPTHQKNWLDRHPVLTHLGFLLIGAVIWAEMAQLDGSDSGTQGTVNKSVCLLPDPPPICPR
jgi:hypothetical protein